MPHDWYQKVVGRELQQCDILKDVPVIRNSPDLDPVALANKVARGEKVPSVGAVRFEDLIVLTQTCDIVRDDQKFVLAATVFEWSRNMRPGLNRKDRENFRKQIIGGKILQLCALPEREEKPVMKWSVVDFRELVTMPKEYLEKHAESVGERLRMKSPYREHVAHCFANSISRIAIENQLLEFVEYDPELPSPSAETA